MKNSNASKQDLLRHIAALEEENKQLTQKLSTKQAEIDLLTWGTETAIWRWHYPTGKVTFSAQKAEMLGYTPEELNLNVNGFIQMVHPDDRETVLQAIDAHLSGKKAVFETEYRIKTKSGGYIWFYDKGRITSRDSNGQILEVAGVVSDISARRQVLQDLKESEQRFRGLFEHSNQGVRIVNEKGYVIEQNNAMGEITGYSPEETIGMHISDVLIRQIPPEEETSAKIRHIKKKVDRILHTGEANQAIDPDKTYALTTKTGEVKYVTGFYFAVQKENGYWLYAIINNETARIKAEEELRHANQQLRLSEEKFRMIAENTSDGILVFDAQGAITYASPSMKHISARSSEAHLEMDPEKIYEKLHPDDRDRVFQAIREAIAQKRKSLIYTYRAIGKSGAYYWREDHARFRYDEAGAYAGTYVICRDITKRKKQEALIRKLSKAVESAKASIVVTDYNGMIEYANSYFTVLTGYTKEDYLHRKTNIVRSNYHDQAFYKELWETIKAGKTWEGEFFNKKKNGETYWEYSIISPIINESGEIENFVAVKTDISGQKRINEELKAAKEKAEESDRLKSAFLKNLSHEVRTPMNAITGFSDMLLRKTNCGKEQTRYLQIINESSYKLLQTVENILHISHLETGQVKLKYRPFKIFTLLNRLYDELLEKQHRQHKTDIAISMMNSAEKEDITIYSDFSRVYQMLNILLDNALKFTASGCIKFGYTTDKKSIHFVVEDTGVGFSEDKKELAFKTFTQASETSHALFGGLGVGLSICAGLVNLMNGSIDVQSHEHKGTRITVALPWTSARENC